VGRAAVDSLERPISLNPSLVEALALPLPRRTPALISKGWNVEVSRPGDLEKLRIVVARDIANEGGTGLCFSAGACEGWVRLSQEVDLDDLGPAARLRLRLSSYSAANAPSIEWVALLTETAAGKRVFHTVLARTPTSVAGHNQQTFEAIPAAPRPGKVFLTVSFIPGSPDVFLSEVSLSLLPPSLPGSEVRPQAGVATEAAIFAMVRVLLGRGASPRALDDFLGRPTSELLSGILLGDEFARLADSGLLGGEAIPHERHAFLLDDATYRSVQDVYGVGPSTEWTRWLRSARSWREVLVVLLCDADTLERVDRWSPRFARLASIVEALKRVTSRDDIASDERGQRPSRAPSLEPPTESVSRRAQRTERALALLRKANQEVERLRHQAEARAAAAERELAATLAATKVNAAGSGHALGCLNWYRRNLSRSVNELERMALRNRSLAARELLARVATEGRLGYQDFEAASLEARGLEEALGSASKPALRALAALARVVGNQTVTSTDEPLATRLYDYVFSKLRPAEARLADRILHVDLLTQRGRLEQARAFLDQSGLMEAALVDYQCLRANVLRATAESGEDWLSAVNGLMRGIEPLRVVGGSGSCLERLAVKPDGAVDGPMISVLMTTFEPDEGIELAVRSVLEQTWRNLELLIVDDCSSDESFAKVERWRDRDPRIRILRQARNGGTYVAKNHALELARGELVTCHDSDDWSHPRKLEIQARALLAAEDVANISSWIRTTADLEFKRFSGNGQFLYPNMSSLMFRREPVLERAGFWDGVRTGADSEFRRRLEHLFSREIPVLTEAPLSFGQMRVGALTHNSLGNGFESPDRRMYRQYWTLWHERTAGQPQDLVVRAPSDERRFLAPRATLPTVPGDARAYDIVVLSDFRLSSEVTASCIHDVLLGAEAGLRMAICQVHSLLPAVVGQEMFDPSIHHLLQSGAADLVHLHEAVSCRALIVRCPACLQFTAGMSSSISAERVVVVASTAPWMGQDPAYDYDPAETTRNALWLFKRHPVWAPTSPRVRASLQAVLTGAYVAEEDWTEVVPEAAKQGREGFVSDRPTIGRRAPDHGDAWPADKDAMERVYPVDGSAWVHLWGSARAPQKVGQWHELPAHWRVTTPANQDFVDFVRGIDFYVPFLGAAQARDINPFVLDAMSTGCVVVLPPEFEPTYGNAAIYCAPDEAWQTVARVHADLASFRATSQRACAFTNDRHHPSLHQGRLIRFVDGASGRA